MSEKKFVDDELDLPMPPVAKAATKPVISPVISAEDEMKALELEERRLRLQNLREELDERKLKNEEKLSKRLMNGRELANSAAAEAARQAGCNHRQGGQGMGAMNGDGDDAANHAIIKVRLINGDIWARCLRCGKTAKPPVRSAVPNQLDYDRQIVDYRTFIALPTKNTMMGSLICYFSDGGEVLREALKHSNLR